MSTAPRPKVVVGVLGSRLDRGKHRDRWKTWRPTVDLCRHRDLRVARLELLVEPGLDDLAAEVIGDIRRVSPGTEVRSHAVTWDDPWDFQQVFAQLHDLAIALRPDPEAEDYLVHITTGSHVVQICLFLLTESRHLPGRLLQTSPPETVGEVGRQAIIDLDLSRYDRLASRFADERAGRVDALKAGIATRSKAFNKLIERIERVATASKAPMLLTGPTGAGKTQLARRIYELKHARHLLEGPLVEVNCATLRGDGAMSALFGHVKGSFTGAQRDRPGLLRAAHTGLLFLDEIGELGLDEQAMLLRAIEDRRFLPVGADTEVSSDFQLIAGTNRELGAGVRGGKFRDDLLARIDTWTFRLPGLTERREDIEPNLDHELAAWTASTGRRVTLNKEARAAFVGFASSPDARWPGNFRDFNAAITRMATLSTTGRIAEDEVTEEIGRLREAWRGSAEPVDDLVTEVLGEKAAEIDRFDRVQLADVLAVCRHAKTLSDAGRVLFAQSRSRRTTINDADRLRKYLARFDLDWESVSRS